MIVRREQVEAFREPMQSAYVKSAADHMSRYDPVLAEAAGRGQVEKAAVAGLEAARRHQLSAGPGLQLYLELMMSLGSEFDSDPQYSWLEPFLEPRDDVGSVERARFLHFHAVAYLGRTRGTRNAHSRVALDRALEFLTRLRISDMKNEAQPEQLLGWLHPQRLDFIEPKAYAAVVASARSTAAEARLAAPNGTNLLLLLLLLFGTKAAADPLYPWIGQNLGGPGEAASRWENLAGTAGDYIGRVIRSIG